MEIGQHITHHKRFTRVVHMFEVCLMALVLVLVVSSTNSTQVSALGLGQRRVTVIDNGPGTTSPHEFYFDIVTANSVGSIVFEYCTNSPLAGTPCSAPAGLDLTGATLAAESGETGFSISGVSTINRLVIGRAPAITVPGTKFYEFTNIINPTNPNETTYVRISTHSSSDGSGLIVDDGGTAFAVSPNLNINAYVPPFLILCVGVTVQPNCAATSGTNINLGVLASTFTAAASSQFGIATNDNLGYQAYAVGTTMTSGNNTIPPLPTQSPSIVGQSQFGINIRANTAPSIGQDPAGLGTAALTTLYDDPNLFRFQSGDQIASSATSTDFNIFTVSYLVNVSQAQTPGRYSTTMTIVGVAAF